MGGMDEKGVQMHRYAIALLISTLAFLGCATPTVSEGAGPKQEQRDAQAAGQQEDRQGRIGETLRLSGNEHGLEMAVTPRRVVDPAAPADPYAGPGSGKRFVGVEIQLANVGTRVYRDFPANGAALIDSRSRQYQSSF